MTSSLVFAHTGHWAESVLILIPMLSFVIWLALVALRDRRATRDGEPGVEHEQGGSA